jgi:drug/metabolite transporter (DMT)-like permease
MTDKRDSDKPGHNLAGILLMVAAVTTFAMLDATAKYTVKSLSTAMVVCFRYGIASAYVAILVWRMGGARLLVTRHRRLHAMRGLLLLGTTGLNFLALNYIQLAQTSAITFSNPLIVCVLSPWLLGERVGLRRWTAVIAGFIGVLIIIRPGSAGFHWARAASLLSALCGALYQIATRHVGLHDQALTSLFYMTLTGALGAVPLAVIDWQTPEAWQWGLLGLAAIFGTIGHFMLIEAHRRAPASVLAPFIYTQIIPMIIIGFLVFGDVPDAWTLAGGLVVIASGLYVLYRERRPSRRPPAKGGRP